MQVDRGIIYVAVGGEGSIGEAQVSAFSVKQFMPDIPITIFTDSEPSKPKLFDDIRIVSSKLDDSELINLPQYPHHGLMSKVRYLTHTPYDTTLFLDTDTLVCEPVYELFELVDSRFDIALAHCTGRTNYHRLQLPKSFTMFNTGVIAYRKSLTMLRLLSTYWKEYRQEVIDTNDAWSDQSMLQKVLYEHPFTKFYVLPPEYNLRWIFPSFAADKVKILHGHGEAITYVRDAINITHEPRVWYQDCIVAFHTSIPVERKAVQREIDNRKIQYLNSLKQRRITR